MSKRKVKVDVPLKAVVTSFNKSAKRAKWQTLSHRCAIFKREDGRGLSLFIGKVGKLYSVSCVEYSFDNGVQGVLDDHGHKVLDPEFKTEGAARAAAIVFANQWLVSGKSVDGCACEEIVLPKPFRNGDNQNLHVRS